MPNKWTKALFGLTEPVLSRITGETVLPPVFIVGNIRSGTTLVYQYLTGALPLCFFSNLERYYYRTPLSSAAFFKAADKYSFTAESSFGEIPGKYSPSDGWEIFNRFFSNSFDPAITRPLKPLKKMIQQTSFLYNRPFIVKNNANTLRVFELYALFDHALFIRVNRSPVANIRSVLRGRKINAIPAGKCWAIGPAILPEKYRCRSELEEVCFQYQIVHGFLDRFFQSIPGRQGIEVNYESFCESPGDLLAAVGSSYPGITPREGAMVPQKFTPAVPDQDDPLTGDINNALAATRSMAADWVTTIIDQYYSQYTHGAG